MANQISLIVNKIVSIFNNDKRVHTIVFKDDDVIDVEKRNIYPLVNIDLRKSDILDDRINVTIGFAILTQRDDIRKAQPNKLMNDTNYIDNINTCFSIANDFLAEIIRNHNEDDINIESFSEVTFIIKDERNTLDGVDFTAIFSTHQNDI